MNGELVIVTGQLGDLFIRSLVSGTSSAAKHSRVLPKVGGQLQSERKPSPTGMGTEMAGVPSAVHGAFILGSPVVDSPSGAGPVAAGENHRRGLEHLRKSDPAVGEETPGLVVSGGRYSSQYVSNEFCDRLVEPVPKLLQPRLVESTAFVERFDVVRFVQFFERLRDINRVDANACIAQDRQRPPKGACHFWLAFRDWVGCSEHKLFCAAGRVPSAFQSAIMSAGVCVYRPSVSRLFANGRTPSIGRRSKSV